MSIIFSLQTISFSVHIYTCFGTVFLLFALLNDALFLSLSLSLSAAEDDDYGGGRHHPSQQQDHGDGDSDEEPRPVYRPSPDRLRINLSQFI